MLTVLQASAVFKVSTHVKFVSEKTDVVGVITEWFNTSQTCHILSLTGMGISEICNHPIVGTSSLDTSPRTGKV